MTQLTAGDLTLHLAPETGGAIASWTRRGQPLLHPVADPNLAAQHGAAVAAYPLIPFSNRVAWGRFSFGGQSFQLARNFGTEPHTIHGNAWMHPWRVLAAGPDTATLTFDHTPTGANAASGRPGGRAPAGAPPAGAEPDGSHDPAEWPYAYHAEQRFTLRPDGLEVAITLTNRDARPFPAGMGLHPFLPRDPELELGFAAGSVWHTGADALPDARLPVEGPWRFEPPRRLDGPAIDNCYAGWGGAFTLRWPSRGLTMTVAAGAPFGHGVLFTPDGRGFVATEPASNMTDAINRMHREPDHGLVVLAPGASLQGTVRFTLAET